MYQEEGKSEGEQILSQKLNTTKGNEKDARRGTVEVQNQSEACKRTKKEKKLTPPDHPRHRPLRNTKKRYFRPKRVRDKKIYIKKPENGFYDPDKKCFYIPRA